MMRRPWRATLVVLAPVVLTLALAGAGVAVGADVQPLIDASFAALHRGDAAAAPAAKRDAYGEGVRAAEAAVRLDDGRADAHYALFCSLGRLTESRGPIGQALALPRLRAELDRALTLDPRYSEALAAKGEMLLRLPRLLGGDLNEAEALARRALAVAPTYWRAHILLARVLIAQSRRPAARRELTDILASIDPHSHERVEAEELLKTVASGQ